MALFPHNSACRLPESFLYFFHLPCCSCRTGVRVGNVHLVMALNSLHWLKVLPNVSSGETCEPETSRPPSPNSRQTHTKNRTTRDFDCRDSVSTRELGISRKHLTQTGLTSSHVARFPIQIAAKALSGCGAGWILAFATLMQASTSNPGPGWFTIRRALMRCTHLQTES